MTQLQSAAGGPVPLPPNMFVKLNYPDIVCLFWEQRLWVSFLNYYLFVYFFSVSSKFRLSYYPHRVESFKELLKGAFAGKCEHTVYGDFKAYTPNQAQTPCYFVHVLKRTT